jgi:hypothetical protein
MPDAIITQDVADLVERLRIRSQSWARGVQCLDARLDADAANLLEQQAQTLSRVREALEPFAKAADDIEREYGERPSWQYQFPPVMMRDFACAREVLRSLPALPCSGEPYDPNLIDLPSASTEP